MDTYLYSIHKHWNILTFIEKTKEVEIRKSAPKPPFKAIIYEPKNGGGCGKVIGEWICNEVEEFRCCVVPYEKTNNLGYENFIDNGVYQLKEKEGFVFEKNDWQIDTMIKNDDLSRMCLSANEVYNYCGGFGKNIYALHITEPILYDKPKELGEFYSIKQCNPEYSPFGYQWTWEDRHKRNTGGWHNKYRPVPIECHRCKSLVGGEDYLDEKSGCVLFDYECVSKYHKPLQRPPQSYMRIQDTEEV